MKVDDLVWESHGGSDPYVTADFYKLDGTKIWIARRTEHLYVVHAPRNDPIRGIKLDLLELACFLHDCKPEPPT
jgi:hypothetical protein